jgi:hypothetical protein
MKIVGNAAEIQESRLSQQSATNDNVAANEQEVDERIEEGKVENAARENATSVPAPIMRGNDEAETTDLAVASREEVQEQAEESRIDKVAFEDGISTVSAKEYIRNGRDHD